MHSNEDAVVGRIRLNSKVTSTVLKAFQELTTAANIDVPTWTSNDVDIVVVDFDQGQAKALNEAFGQATLQGCFVCASVVAFPRRVRTYT